MEPERRLLQGRNGRDAEGGVRIAHDVLLDHAHAFREFKEADNVLLLADARDAAARWIATEGRFAASPPDRRGRDRTCTKRSG